MHGAERRAARGAEQPGLGERIAQQALQRCAAQAERAADEQCEQRARQADLAEDRVGERGSAEAERRPAAVAPDDQRCGGGRERQQREADDERRRRAVARRRAHGCAARCSNAAASTLPGSPHAQSAVCTVIVRCVAPSPRERRMLEHGVRERRLRASIAGQHDDVGIAAQQRLHRQAAPAIEALLGRDVR